MGAGEATKVSIRQTVLLPALVASALVPLSIAAFMSFVTWAVVRAPGEGAWLWTGAGIAASLVWYSGLGAALVAPRHKVSWAVLAVALLFDLLVMALEPMPYRGGQAACAGAGVFGLTLAAAFIVFRWWWGVASHSTAWSVLTTVLCVMTCSIEGLVVAVSGEALKTLADPRAWDPKLAAANPTPLQASWNPPPSPQSSPRIGAMTVDDVPLSRWSECLEELARNQRLQRDARNMAEPDLISLVMEAVCRRDEKSRLVNLETYFFTSLKNAKTKQQAISPNTCELTEELACPDPREGYVSDFEVRTQKELICQLDREDQTLLVLHFIEGLTWSEVGARVEPPLSENAVKKRFERIRKTLREQWAQLCN